MSAQSIARRYAKSLIDLAQERKNLDAIVNDAKLFQSSLQSRDFELLIKSPIIKPDKKQAIYAALFKDKVQDLMLEFLKIITRKGREKFLPEIMTEVISQYNAINNISTAKLITAVSMDDSVINAIKSKLQTGNGKVELSTATNPDIIGGYVLEMGDKLYDASVHRQLNQLRKELANR